VSTQPFLSIVIPLLNEEESLPELMRWIDEVMQQHEYTYEVCFIDDGSTDDSWKVISELAQKYPAVVGTKFLRNYGKSGALNVGFRQAKGEIIITMDADLQDSPEEIPGLVDRIQNQDFDLVSGWKKKRYDPKFSKNLPSKLYNWAARKISGIELHDFNCGLKAYKSKVIKNIEVYGEMHRYIPVIAKNAGFRKIGEQVVAHQARQFGVTKFGYERFINGFLDLLSISFIGKFGKRPMHFFGAIGGLATFLGTLILAYLTIAKLIYNTSNIDDRPLFFLGILLVIVGIQLFIAGFLAELIIRNSQERNNYKIESTLP
jgi:glycosyltransferase involved in cell wall biosynthesis